MRLALAAALLALLPASAEAAWTGQDLSAPHTFVDDPGLVVSPSGRALAFWRFHDGTGNRARSGNSGATRAPGASGFGTAVRLVPASGILRPGAILDGIVATRGDGALLAERLPGAGDTVAGRLAVRFGSTSGRFGRPRTIRRAAPFSIPHVALAANARGDAVLTWFEDRGVRTDRVYVALRRAGHGFGTPRRLATGRIRGVAAAIGERGDALVGWDARGTLRTRFKPRGRKGFRATDTIRSKPAYFADMHPVVTPSGRALLAWSAQFRSEGGTSGPVRFQTAARAAGARRFARARLLETIPARAYDGLGRAIDAVADTAGVVTVAWRGRQRRARLARRRARPDAVGAGHDRGLLRPRGRAGRAARRGLGRRRRRRGERRARRGGRRRRAAVRGARGRLGPWRAVRARRVLRRPPGRDRVGPQRRPHTRAGLRQVDGVGRRGGQERDRDPRRDGGRRLVQVAGAADQEAEHHQGEERRRRGLVHGRESRLDPVSAAAPESAQEVEAGLREAGYLAGDSTALVSYLAARLGKPVLVEGPAGVGKTELAKALARYLDRSLVRLQCYEGLDEAKALYEWNYRKQLLRIQAESKDDAGWQSVQDDIFGPEFLLARPLMQAIASEEPVVLLIDEIDKTDQEFEAMLLELLSDFQITIPELGRIEARTHPVVLLTSNNSRELTEALKRRCLYLWLDYPSIEHELEIVRLHAPELPETVARRLVEVVAMVRELDLKKPPSIAESIDWARALLLMGADDITAEVFRSTLSIIVKHRTDLDVVAERVGVKLAA